MFKSKLRECRKRKGFSQAQLASRIGVTRQAISRWESGADVPGLFRVAALASVLDVSLEELMPEFSDENKKAPAGSPGEGEKRTIISMDDWIKVPIVSREWTACCGPGISAADITNWDEGVVLIDRTKLYRFDDRRMPFAIHCEGDCMESAGIKDGDLAIINPAEEPQQGAVVLVSVAGSLSLKRFYSTPSGDVILRSDLGQTRLTVSDMERDEFMVCGVLVGTYQGRPKPLPL